VRTQTVIPQLRITNARRSLAFYVEGLGFAVDWEHQFEPGFPLFMQLTRKGQTIFLTEHTGDCEVGGAVYLVVPDVDHCFAEFSARGVVPTEPPTTVFALPATPLRQWRVLVGSYPAPNPSVKGAPCSYAQTVPYIER